MMPLDRQWDLTDGILAQSKDEHTLVINQLSSSFRGIEARHWEYRIEFRIKAQVSDVRQDLLVVIEQLDEWCVPDSYTRDSSSLMRHSGTSTACICYNYRLVHLTRGPKSQARESLTPQLTTSEHVLRFKSVTTISGSFSRRRS